MTMGASDALPRSVLTRKAVVYVRQSTPQQMRNNLESQRSQYDLVDVARRDGFAQVEVIDDDLGRSASGAIARPGFERLVAWLCAMVSRVAGRRARSQVWTRGGVPVARPTCPNRRNGTALRRRKWNSPARRRGSNRDLGL